MAPNLPEKPGPSRAARSLEHSASSLALKIDREAEPGLLTELPAGSRVAVRVAVVDWCPWTFPSTTTISAWLTTCPGCSGVGVCSSCSVSPGRRPSSGAAGTTMRRRRRRPARPRVRRPAGWRRRPGPPTPRPPPDRLHADPRGDRRPVPRRRHQRPQRARRERRRAQRHPVQLRLVDGTAEGVPMTIEPRPSRRHGGAPLARRGRLRVALRPRGPATRCTPRASRTRTTCAACRSPTPTAWSRSTASSRPPTRAGGRTSTSRSTRAWTATTDAANADRHVAGRPARGRRRRGVRHRRATSRACRTSPRLAGERQRLRRRRRRLAAGDGHRRRHRRVHGRPRRRRRPDRRVDRWRRWRPPTRSVTITTRRMPRQAYGGCRCVVRTASASSRLAAAGSARRRGARRRATGR